MKKTITQLYLIASAVLFSLSSTSTMAREYYKWVDSNGSTHYTTTPPPKNAKKQGRVETFGTKSSTIATTPTQQNEQVPTTNNQEQTKPDTQVETTMPVEPVENAQPLK